MLSDPTGFAINKSLTGGRVTYTAVRLGKPWAPRRGEIEREPRAWDGSTILHVERDIAPDNPPKGSPEFEALVAAMNRCKEACEQCV